MRPRDVLADQSNKAEFNGVNVRNGTVAAFLANAKSLLEPAIADAVREAGSRDIAALRPAPRSLGLFEIFEIRGRALRAFVAARP